MRLRWSNEVEAGAVNIYGKEDDYGSHRVY
jgi:hypothetical protein